MLVQPACARHTHRHGQQMHGNHFQHKARLDMWVLNVLVLSKEGFGRLLEKHSTLANSTCGNGCCGP
jgi:hypothetical protein